MGSLGELPPLLPLSFSRLSFCFRRSDNNAAVGSDREEQLLSLEMALGIGGGVRAEGQVEQARKFSVHRWGGGGGEEGRRGGEATWEAAA